MPLVSVISLQMELVRLGLNLDINFNVSNPTTGISMRKEFLFFLHEPQKVMVIKLQMGNTHKGIFPIIGVGCTDIPPN